MKIFISWSGVISHKVALALRDWLPLVLPNIRPFVSSEDIRKGNQWRTTITSELNETKFGIACLTQDNFTAPWLLFETGALSKSLEDSSVCTLLIPPLKSETVKGPLSAFQHTVFTKEDVGRLVSALNMQNRDNVYPQPTLDKIFAKWWDDLDAEVKKIIAEAPQKAPAERAERDMLIELLDLTRTLSRHVSTPSAFQTEGEVDDRYRPERRLRDLEFRRKRDECIARKQHNSVLIEKLASKIKVKSSEGSASVDEKSALAMELEHLKMERTTIDAELCEIDKVIALNRLGIL